MRRQRQIGQRMPDELGFDAALAIELLLEGEDHQHLADVLPHQLDARLPPRPQLRADVVDHRDAALVQLARQAKIEVGEVDQHGGVGAAAFGLGHHVAKAPVDARDVLDHLDHADHRDLVSVDHEFASGLRACARRPRRRTPGPAADRELRDAAPRSASRHRVRQKPLPRRSGFAPWNYDR